MRDSPVIEIQNLQKTIDGITVVDIPSLEVSAGQVVALIGPPEGGKESLFELLTGRERPTLGTVRLAGIDPYTDREAFSRRVGVLFPDDNLYARQSVAGNLKFYSRLYRLPRTRIPEILDQVGLADQANSRVDGLSPSLARRLAFGRAILQEPQALILAEPHTSCDESSAALISRLIQAQAKSGVAVLILGGDLTNLMGMCDALYRLEAGRAIERIEETRGDPGLPFMIPARLEGKVALVDPSEILFVSAQDDRAYLQTTEDRLPTQFTLTELEKRLAPSGFFRAHRSYLVNLQHVKEVIPYTRDSFTLRLKDQEGTEIPLSKTAARELRELLGY